MFSKVRFNLRTKIILGYLIVLIGLSISILLINDRVTSMKADREYITGHDFQVHNLSNEIEKNILDMEGGQRGYVVTGDTRYLIPYNNGVSSWKENYSKLRQLVMDNPKQVQNLASIRTNIEHWINEAGDPVITMKKENNNAGIIEFFKTDIGKKYTDQLRSQLAAFRSTELSLTDARSQQLISDNEVLLSILNTIWVIVSAIAILIALVTSSSIVKTIKQVTDSIKHIAASKGDLSMRVEVKTNDEVGDLAEVTNELLTKLEQQNWVSTEITDMATTFQGVTDMKLLTQSFINRVAGLVEAHYGVLYLRQIADKKDVLTRFASYAGQADGVGTESFRIGEGLVGQSALENRILILNQLPNDYIKVASGLGHTAPQQIIIAPIKFEKNVLAVMELASLSSFTKLQQQLLEQIVEPFGVTLHNAASRTEIENLYSESQTMAEELQAQTEELQTQAEELQVQTEELRSTNEHLEEQNLFAEQKSYEVEQAKKELEQYAEQLQQSSQYKSEFLANMSHELRTPLNSLLILSQFLVENANGTLNADEQEYARIINSSGKDLLSLINDILDLSKVEAGKLEIEIAAVNLTELPHVMERNFTPIAKQRNLQFRIIEHPGLPSLIFSDEQRLQQILKNLLSNAFKFTESGTVTLSIRKADSLEANIALPHASSANVIAFSVSDTGIGIPDNKRLLIFEAFQQVDGKTERKYGGTGLGLSISREFASLLGGSIALESEEGIGSTFTLYVPCLQNSSSMEMATMYAESSAASVSTPELPETPPVNNLIVPNTEPALTHLSVFDGKQVLVVDDDVRNIFALTKALEMQGMSVITAHNGRQCLDMLDLHKDVDIVLMDIMMPEMDGYQTMRHIRRDRQLNEMPIIALTAKAMKYDREKCLEAGASDYISKPIHLEQLFSVMRVWLSKS
ncbi:two-component system, chemotaxis family, sensor kinase CheA [Paenibacillus sp. 1_12]|uniref:CHASE3 domain-containing protein n=1 Tax=Paenibacillus sp. 1_12 TaxID=1566278 RepID=UPI0008EA56FC|nr:CHASE3 domain-containing protein [Paenibacillus sp. 1_12]SFL24557.1 two-component system, chemotaxis family, sensor kinase CheA [Paenibacillus sp. 1_12]